MKGLELKNVHISIDGKEIIKGITLSIRPGEVVALMGPNGSGKSTLASAIMGKPDCVITKGEALYNGQDIRELLPEERSKQGIFLSFQHPVEFPGLNIYDYLREICVGQKQMSALQFRQVLKDKMKLLGISHTVTKRYLNDGFSGGEKKRMEILQMALLEPSLAILDETDSGLDIDALRIVAEGVNSLKNEHMGVLCITHYSRILDYLKPDRVVVLVDGLLAQEGGPELVVQLEEHGFDLVKK